MNTCTRCLRTPLKAPWKAIQSTSLPREAFSSRGFVSTVSRSTKIQSRRISTDSSKSSGNKYGNRTKLAFALAVSGFTTTVILLYGGHRDAVRMDWQPKRKPAVDPTPAPSSGKPVPLVNPYTVLGHEPIDVSKFPVEDAILTTAPNVPPPITRDHPALLRVPLTTTTKLSQLTSVYKYDQWTFNDSVPGPFIRARAGDVIELTITNKDPSGNPHNIDCHAFIGPGGGAPLTTVGFNESKTARFQLLYPGLYVYHCAAAPVPVHIANGMYGMIYVQQAEGDLPPVDKEYFVLQSEFYHEPPEVEDDGRPSSIVEFSYPNALREEPNVVVFNGSESALTRDKPLTANINETVRLFFGNAGPNLTSSFHVIGSNFKNVYREGDVISPPGQCIQTVSVPPGSATIVDMEMSVPGTYALVDHAIFRMDKGAVGYLNVSGEQRPDIYGSTQPPAPCVGCKLHP
ncbi:copper-containing nitrite reductase [Coccidioides posadasii str. Silveira]|uniref:Copper-containing nitrite reductase n=1 Tax=Coccidioides posadasii (strain RMSCC 757 / Silveira) TaxID=443226 RepID=E9DHQ8_COCPS|nr:copper-containing nitrite reductase [Coccidioides posadasii str. Silveira]